jgi:hypothetical protein
MRGFLLLFIFIFTLASVPLARAADPVTYSLFPRGAERCYSFNPKESAKGTLSYFAAFRLLRENPSSESIDRPAAEQVAADLKSTTHFVSVIARVKGDAPTYQQDLICNDEGKTMRCAVECDGGFFTARKAGKDVVLNLGSGFVVSGGCGANEVLSRDISQKQAPGGVTLTAADPKLCAAARSTAAAKILRDAVPLRKRIADGGWTCLSRKYDAAELAPNQNVKALAVRIVSPPQSAKADTAYFETRMQVALAVTLKDGKTAKTTENCVANDDEFVCGEAFRLRRRDASTALLELGGYAVEAGDPLPSTLAGLSVGKQDQLFRLNGGTGNCE